MDTIERAPEPEQPSADELLQQDRGAIELLATDENCLDYLREQTGDDPVPYLLRAIARELLRTSIKTMEQSDALVALGAVTMGMLGEGTTADDEVMQLLNLRARELRDRVIASERAIVHLEAEGGER